MIVLDLFIEWKFFTDLEHSIDFEFFKCSNFYMIIKVLVHDGTFYKLSYNCQIPQSVGFKFVVNCIF